MLNRYIFVFVFWPATLLATELGETDSDANSSDSPHVSTIDGFRIESSLLNKIVGGESIVEEHKTRIVLLSKPSYPTIGLEKDFDEIGSYGVAIFQRESGAPNLNVIDRNGDGKFDYLQFSVLAEDGNLLKDVYDYGMDGQNEVILDFEKNKQKILYKGTWYEAKFKENFVLELEQKEISIKEAFEYFEKNH